MNVDLWRHYMGRINLSPFKMAEAQSCTWVSGILEESCIAGVTIFIDSLELPKDRKMCPKRTRAHTVNRLRSSALAIFSVSLRYLLKSQKNIMSNEVHFKNLSDHEIFFMRTLHHYILRRKILEDPVCNTLRLEGCAIGMEVFPVRFCREVPWNLFLFWFAHRQWLNWG